MNKVLPYERGPQVLRVLMKHGPLSPAGLRYILQPPIKKRRLKEVLKRLHERGLLYKRRDLYFNDTYFQINQHPSAYRKLSQMLGLPPETFHLPHFRRMQPTRSESHASWAEKLMRIFPEAYVYREYEISAQVFKEIFPSSKEFHPKLLPDLTLHWKAEAEAPVMNAAFIFEADHRSDTKHVAKVNYYSSLNDLDLILLIATPGDFERKYKLTLSRHSIKRAIRSSVVGPYYFCATYFEDAFKQANPMLINANKDCISLVNLIKLLRIKKMAEITKTNGECPAVVGLEKGVNFKR